MKKMSVKDARNQFANLLKGEDTVIVTRHSVPAGVLTPILDEDDFIEWRMRNDPESIARLRKAHDDLAAGRVFSEEEMRQRYLGETVAD